MNEALVGYRQVIEIVRVVLFWLALAVATIALVDWAVRTRRLNPFGPIARFFRRFVDPLMAPVERIVVRRGGQPSAAPWWSLVVVVVGGILLLALLNFLAGVFTEIYFGVTSPSRFAALLVKAIIRLLQLALIVRVVSSWISLSPHSRLLRWTHALTEWMLAPLRRVIPMFGPVDITPLVAYFALAILGGMLFR